MKWITPGGTQGAVETKFVALPACSEPAFGKRKKIIIYFQNSFS